MSTTNTIGNRINKLPEGYVFTYSDLIDDLGNKKEAVIKALNRMASSGKISKLTKGKYYKPEATIFGDLQPIQYQIVKDLLENDGQVIGYLTGFSIYNKLGLTTQVSNVIQIGKNDIRAQFKRERFTISFIRQKNSITKEAIPLLQILDAFRYIKKIPDTSVFLASKRLLAIVKELSESDKTRIVKLALKYPPATRALLGAILEEIGEQELAESLRKSLNPITEYKLSGVGKAISSSTKWNIQ